MAEYIDKQKYRQEWLKFKTFEPMKCLDSIPIADVVERSEYEKLLKENEELKEIATNCIEADSQSCEELTKLHSKIDNAIKEIEQAIKECKLRWAVTGMEHALGILKRSIGE